MTVGGVGSCQSDCNKFDVTGLHEFEYDEDYKVKNIDSYIKHFANELKLLHIDLKQDITKEMLDDDDNMDA